MLIKSVDEIIQEVKARYDKEPTGWRVLKGIDTKGHHDTFISQGEKHFWQLKTEFRNPYEVMGVGAKLELGLDDEIRRVLDRGKPRFFGEIYKPKQNPILAFGIGNYSDNSTSELKNILSSRQEELEKKLNKNLDKLLHREGMFKEFG